MRIPRASFISLPLLALLALLAAPEALAQQAPPGADTLLTRGDVQRTIAGLRWIDTTRGIDELRAIEVGGITQWISIRGRDRRNPILLYVHGGPGSPTMPNAWYFQTPWEEYFTVVQWDQRGAGKTRAANDQKLVGPTVRTERMIADAEEVVQYLRGRFAKEKIVLLGHSWGTIIGVNVAQRHPEWLHAYIAMGQVVWFHDNERIGYEWALDAATREGNREAIAELEGIAPYPNADGTIPIAKILVQRKWVIHYGGLTWGRRDFSYEVAANVLSPDYTARDVAALGEGDLSTLEQLLGPPNRYDYRSFTRFGCPVFVLGGKYDYETVTEVARKWYETIRAPKKGFVFFEHSAHMMTFEEPGRLFLHLVNDVWPIAVAAGDGPRRRAGASPARRSPLGDRR